MERVGALLESFSQAFVELRKGYEQFGEEMALQLVQERNPLHDALRAKDVLRYLLDWNVDGNGACSRAQRARFADLALHQVALLSGVMEGVRSMLHRRSRRSPAQRPAHRTRWPRTGGAGFFEKIFNSKKAGLWKHLRRPRTMRPHRRGPLQP